MTRSHLHRSVLHSTAGTALTRGIGALGGIVIARLLGPAARGDVAILVVGASIAALLGAAGLQFWIIRDVARRAGVATSTVAVVVRHSLAVLALAAVVALGVGAVLVPDVLSASTWAATVAFAATGAIAFVWLALPNGARSMGLVSVATAAASAVYVGGALVLLMVDRPSVTAVMTLAAVGNVVTIAVCMTWVARHRRLAPDGDPVDVGSTWRHGLRFGAAGGAGELVLFGMLRIDFLLVALFLPASAVGVYAVATALTELLWVIPDGTAQITLPSAAGSDGNALPTVFRLTLVLTALAGIVLSAAAAPLLDVIFGADYVAGAAAVPFLAVAALAGGAWKMLAADLAARHSTRDRLTSATLGLVVMVAADLVLIPAFGIAGAAAGAALGYTAAAALVLRVWCATTGRPARVIIGLRSGDLHALRGGRSVVVSSGSPS